MREQKFIAAISSYTFDESESDVYDGLFLYKDLDDLKNKLDFLIRFIYVYKSLNFLNSGNMGYEDMNPVFTDIKMQIETTFRNISGNEKRVRIEIFDLFKVFHIEFLGPINDELEWLNNTNEVKIIRTLTEEFFGRVGIQKVVGLSGIDDLEKPYFFEDIASSDNFENNGERDYFSSVEQILD